MKSRALWALFMAIEIAATIPGARALGQAVPGVTPPPANQTDPNSPNPCEGAVNGQPVIPPGLNWHPPTNLPGPSAAEVAAATAQGKAIAQQQGLVQPNASPPPSPSPCGSPPPTTPGHCLPTTAGVAPTMQECIYEAAMAFVGTNTAGLHGAPGDNACMASVNQILINAGITPIGLPLPYGTNSVPDAVIGTGAGRLAPISQSTAVRGDVMVRHSPGDTYTSVGGDEHITICVDATCQHVVSNSSSIHTFGWFSEYELLYPGSPFVGGYSDFYRVQP